MKFLNSCSGFLRNSPNTCDASVIPLFCFNLDAILSPIPGMAFGGLSPIGSLTNFLCTFVVVDMVFFKLLLCVKGWNRCKHAMTVEIEGGNLLAWTLCSVVVAILHGLYIA